MGTYTSNENNTETYYKYTYDMTDDGVANATDFTDVFTYDSSDTVNHAGAWLRSEWENTIDGTSGSYASVAVGDAGAYQTTETWSDGTNTSTWTYNYDTNGAFTGGTSLDNGITTTYKADWTIESQTANTDNLSTLTADDGMAYELFGAVKYQETDSWSDNGNSSTEVTYYNTDGTIKGTSNTYVDTWTDGEGNSVTNTNISYNDADWNWLGSEWSDDNGNSGSNTSTTIANAAIDLDGNGSNDITGSVEVDSGTNTWTSDNNGTAETETSEYTWYYATDGGAFLGGKEVRNGETTVYDSNWDITSQTANVTGLTALTDADGMAFDIFGAALSQETNSWTDDWGTSTETTYYDTDGTKLGTSNTSTNTWTDWENNEVASTNTWFNDNDWNWLGSEYSDSNGNSGSNRSTIVTDTNDLDGDNAKDDTIRVDSGTDTWTWDNNGTTETETSTYTWNYSDDNNWTFLGGTETRNGETTVYDSSWNVLSQTFTIDTTSEDLIAVTDTASMEYTTFDGIATFTNLYKIETNNWSDSWDEGSYNSKEYTYYDEAGNKLGTGNFDTNTWHDDYQDKDITNTNTSFNDADWNWLGSSWSDDQGNSGTNSRSVTADDFSIDLDNDTSTDNSITGAVKVESGSQTNTWDGTEETSNYTWYYSNDDNWTFLGGTEERNGETTTYGADWTVISREMDMTNNADLVEVTDTTSLEYTAFDGISEFTTLYKIETNTWSDTWDDGTYSSVEYTYYDDAGTKLGNGSFSTNTWTDWDGNIVTSNNQWFNDENWNNLGSSWSDSNGNSGSNSSSIVDGTSIDLAEDGTADYTGTANVRADTGTNTWTWDGKEETSTYTWYYENGTDVNTDGNDNTWDFLGGTETRNGETTVWDENWNIISQSISAESLTAISAAPTDLFSSMLLTVFPTATSYLETNSWNDTENGNSSVEYSFYDTDGAKLGTSNTNTNTWYDDWQDKDITNTNTSYNTIDAAGNWKWLGSEWSDNNGNSGTNTSTIMNGSDVDINGDSSADGFTGTDNVRVESGTNTNTWDGNTETSTYTWYYEDGVDANNDSDIWDFLGGTEVRNGETTVYDSDWNIISQTMTLPQDATTLTEADGMAYDIFGAAAVIETNNWSDDWGTSVEYTYYDADGAKLGTSNTSTNTWHDDWQDKDITNTNTSYNTIDAAGNWKWLGSEWSDDNGNSGSNMNTVEDVTRDWDNNASTDDTTVTVTVESGSNTSTWENNGTTETETSNFTWYRSTTDDSFLGGTEVRNGETTTYGADWTVISRSMDLTGITDTLADTDGMAYDLFGAAKYVETNSWSDDTNGNSNIEYSYYDADGNKLGTSNTNTNTWHDDYQNEDIISTNTSYNTIDAAGNWKSLGNEWSDTNGNSGSNTSTVGAVTRDWDNNVDTADTTLEVRTDTGTNTNIWDNNGTPETQTGNFTFYFEDGIDLNNNQNNWDFLGGTETKGTNTVVYGENWEIISGSFGNEMKDDPFAEATPVYDTDGTTIIGYESTDTWTNDHDSGNQTSHYDVNMKLISTDSDITFDGKTVTEHTDFTYDENGLLLSGTGTSSHTTGYSDTFTKTYNYDTSGTLLGSVRVADFNDENSNTGTITEEFDANGQIISSLFSNENNKNASIFNTNISFDASSDSIDFQVLNTSNEYIFTINGFGDDDTLDASSASSLSNTDTSDGIVDVVYSSAVIKLTGLTTDQDAAITSLDYFTIA